MSEADHTIKEITRYN
ncbi:hypothetical protein F383_02917 [Gossypium arboreum]|uniref:Uncharacterized protein n=1 Tax=Gossypium arboreum TaxID=29729 RepID=A0A0B0NXD4_GOSAR|nr:hypothetical protein F383_09962 [Gossypium arboreum]KHG23388.1 hypothetical protein F383_02917 [Gossypium arboreum]